MNIEEAIQSIESFQGYSLTNSLSLLESTIVGADSRQAAKYCRNHKIDEEFMPAALMIKRMAGQINVIIHAAGILQTLPTFLEEGEHVESVSLGAGNTGRKFDLETNRRVAEFKFIDWQGGAESIRQNGLFKDFFTLAEYQTKKKKYLFVVGTGIPLKFLNGGRALTSVCSKMPAIYQSITDKYGDDMKIVRDYYLRYRDTVNICDMKPYIGRLTV